MCTVEVSEHARGTFQGAHRSIKITTVRHHGYPSHGHEQTHTRTRSHRWMATARKTELTDVLGWYGLHTVSCRVILVKNEGSPTSLRAPQQSPTLEPQCQSLLLRRLRTLCTVTQATPCICTPSLEGQLVFCHLTFLRAIHDQKLHDLIVPCPNCSRARCGNQARQEGAATVLFVGTCCAELTVPSPQSCPSFLQACPVGVQCVSGHV